MGFDFALNLPQFNTEEYDPEKMRALVDELERLYAAVTAEGGQPTILTVITTSHTAGFETFILVDDDTAGGDVTIALPPAGAIVENVYHIKKLGTTGDVIVDADGSETIDGALTAVITLQDASIMIVSDDTSWRIV